MDKVKYISNSWMHNTYNMQYVVLLLNIQYKKYIIIKYTYIEKTIAPSLSLYVYAFRVQSNKITTYWRRNAYDEYMYL